MGSIQNVNITGTRQSTPPPPPPPPAEKPHYPTPPPPHPPPRGVKLNSFAPTQSSDHRLPSLCYLQRDIFEQGGTVQLVAVRTAFISEKKGDNEPIRLSLKVSHQHALRRANVPM